MMYSLSPRLKSAEIVRTNIFYTLPKRLNKKIPQIARFFIYKSYDNVTPEKPEKILAQSNAKHSVAPTTMITAPIHAPISLP